MSTSNEVPQSGQIAPDSSTAKKINNLLNSSRTRLEGLQLLNLFVRRCSDEVFLNFCVSWMQNCCKVDGLTKNRNYAPHVLCNLLKASSKYPELKKSVSFFITTRYFDFFFKHLLNSEAGWACTETCLCLYRGACGPFQEGLEKHLTLEIEKNVNIPLTIARCFALLPCTGGSGSDGINYKRNWKNQFVKLLSICHSALNDMFADVEDFQEQQYEAPELRHNAIGIQRTTEHIAVQFQNHCMVLGFMLLNQYPAPKTVPTSLIFQLICRGLALNPKALGKNQTTNVLSLQKVLPEIHCTLLSLLKALIVSCKNQLLPYSHLICKLIKQSLKVTESDFSNGSEKLFICLRGNTYETLCDWLAVARSGSCVEVISDVVVSKAVNDVRPKRGVVFLKEAKPRKLAKNTEQTTREIDSTANSELCKSALKALQFLLKFVGVLLKAEVQKFLQESVLKLLIEIQKTAPSDVVVPFASPACRIELYSLLLELVHQPCPNWPPPTNFAVKLFTKGVNDSSAEVSSFCSAALNYTTIIIHPQFDNGGFTRCDSADNGIRADEVQWEEPMDVVSEKETISSRGNENLGESEEADSSKKVDDTNEGSEYSSDEDSRNTVTFTTDVAEFTGETVVEGKEEEVLLQRISTAEGDSNAGRQTEFPEKSTPETTPVPTEESLPNALNLRRTPDSSATKKLPESDHSRDRNRLKSISPESANEDGHPKGRYFLRSKRNESSEEPEEELKRTYSAESLKGTPAKTKMTPSGQNLNKRPRTRALSKIVFQDGNGESETKTPGRIGNDDEEDIRAAFDDSFVD